MKREIKFRAWHIEERRFINLNGFDIQFKGCTNPNSVYTIYEQGRLKAIAPQEYELMQYTGLQDKNGKDIYEGDIVKCGDIIVAVTWKDAAFHIITNEAQGTSPFVQERARRFEVIGNIYENPELLNS